MTFEPRLDALDRGESLLCPSAHFLYVTCESAPQARVKSSSQIFESSAPVATAQLYQSLLIAAARLVLPCVYGGPVRTSSRRSTWTRAGRPRLCGPLLRSPCATCCRRRWSGWRQWRRRRQGQWQGRRRHPGSTLPGWGRGRWWRRVSSSSGSALLMPLPQFRERSDSCRHGFFPLLTPAVSRSASLPPPSSSKSVRSEQETCPRRPRPESADSAAKTLTESTRCALAFCVDQVAPPWPWWHCRRGPGRNRWGDWRRRLQQQFSRRFKAAGALKAR